jgi:signal transduction histidine kinase
LFTILFSTLLIHEEYISFEKNVLKDEKNYLIAQYDEVKKVSHRIDVITASYIQHSDLSVGAILKIVADAFDDTGRRFIQVYDNDLNLIHGVCHIDKKALHHMDFESEALSKIHVNDSNSNREALVSTKIIDDYIVLSGLYTQSSDTFFSMHIKEMKSRLVRIMLEIVTLAFILFGFIWGINKIVGTLLERDVNIFLNFFSKAAKKSEYMDFGSMFFKEFHLLVAQANNMVQTIDEQKSSLKQLNITLEDKVKAKTLALKSQNDALEKEKAFSQELLNAQRLFLRHTVHETNTPLSVIIANIDLFALKYGSNKYLEKIDAAVKNIFTIYDDLSYMVKKDQIEYPLSVIDLVAYVNNRVEFFKEVARLAHLSFHVSSSVEQSMISFNETKLQRIIDNNITNAIKYTIPNEIVHVGITCDDEKTRLEIASKSYKIEDTKKVFAPFYQEAHEAEGFGIGLSLVHSICNQEDVTIELESNDELTRFRYGFKRIVE